MNYIKSYLLSFFMFTISSLFPMTLYENSSSLMGTNNTGVDVLSGTNYHKNLFYINNQRNIVRDLAGIILWKIIEQVKQIQNKIDEKHLGITKDTWFRSIVGSYRSFCKSHSLTDQQVNFELEQIESY